MKLQAIILPLFFILMMVPLTLFSQDLETIISADQITVQPDNILKAYGNVKVKRGNVSIKAEALSVNEKTKQIEIQDIVEFYDGNSLKLSGKNAVLSDDLSSGIITASQVLIDDTIRIRAKKIKLRNSALERADGITRITSCEECESGLPLWFFTASSAISDVNNQNITYRDVTMRVRGLPVGYIPYLRMPTPNVDRAQGFLIPGLLITSNLGVGLKLPYFIPITQSRDLLVTPYLSPKTKTLEYRYREKLSNGDIIINGALSVDNLSNESIRSYFEANGSFKLPYGVDLKIKAGQAKDKTYLSDYSYGSEDNLNTDVKLSKVIVNKIGLFSGTLNYVRNNKDDSNSEEYYALNGVYKKHSEQTFLPGNLSFEVKGNSALNVAEGGQVTRPPSFVSSEIQYSNHMHRGRVKISDQSFARLTSFVNSENIESFQEEFIVQFGASSTFSIPFYKAKNTLIHQLVPKFMLSYNSQRGRTKGNYFVGADQLSVGNIYNGEKIVSSSESELGFSISGGLDYRINFNDERTLDLRFGGAWIQSTTSIQNQNGQLQPKAINYVGGFNYQTNSSFIVSGDTLISNKGKILNANLSSRIEVKDYNLTSQYEFIEAHTNERIKEDLENINLSFSYKGFENFGVSMTRRYDLSKNSMAASTSLLNMGFSAGLWDYRFSQTFDRREPEKSQIAAIYDDNCTRVMISLQNASQTAVSSESIQTLSLLVQLKPFSGFSVPGL